MEQAAGGYDVMEQAAGGYDVMKQAAGRYDVMEQARRIRRKPLFKCRRFK